MSDVSIDTTTTSARPVTANVLRRPFAVGLVLFATALAVMVPTLLWFRASVLSEAERRLSDDWRADHVRFRDGMKNDFARMERSAALLGRTLSECLARPRSADAQDYLKTLTAGDDGIWRTKRERFDATVDCGIWVPPYTQMDDRRRAEFMDMANAIAVFGRGAIGGLMTDAYALTGDGANFLIWPVNGDYIYKTGLEMDYRTSDWVKVASPAQDPAGLPRWTPPIYDPAPKLWWVGVAAPFQRNGRWDGVAGHDVIAQSLFGEMQRYDQLALGHVAVIAGDQLILSNRLRERLDANQGQLALATLGEEDGGAVIRSVCQRLDTAHPVWSGVQDGYRVEAEILPGPGWLLVDLQSIGAMHDTVLVGYDFLWWAISLPVGALVLMALVLVRREIRRHQGIENTLRSAIAAAEAGRDEVRRLNADLERRVTERTSQLTSSVRELESFSYSVSHDLRAPLRAIDGFARVLEEDYHERLDDEGRSHLRRILTATQRMGLLIDDLLALARIARRDLDLGTVDLSLLASEVLTGLAGLQGQRRVVWSVAPGMSVRADIGLLRVLLDNLLGNAWKFTALRDPGRIEVRSELHDGKRWVVIADNGAGFDMAYADKLFQPFQRLHSQREFDGTGIGLATVMRVITRHGGEITAESRIDHGATFRFHLPD